MKRIGQLGLFCILWACNEDKSKGGEIFEQPPQPLDCSDPPTTCGNYINQLALQQSSCGFRAYNDALDDLSDQFRCSLAVDVACDTLNQLCLPDLRESGCNLGNAVPISCGDIFVFEATCRHPDRDCDEFVTAAAHRAEDCGESFVDVYNDLSASLDCGSVVGIGDCSRFYYECLPSIDSVECESGDLPEACAGQLLYE